MMEHSQMEQFYQQWAIEEAQHKDLVIHLKVLGFVGFVISLIMVICTLTIVLAIEGVL